MRYADLIRMGRNSLTSHPMRSGLTALGIGIGIAAIVLLSSIGAGVADFVLKSFSDFGTRIVGINPGKTTTHGVPVGMFGAPRPLTIEDAEALGRLSQVTASTSIVQGNAEVEAGKRRRRVDVLGVGHLTAQMFHMNVAAGAFLPPDDPVHPRPFAVLGSTTKRELYGGRSALGERIRVGGERYRVIGVMEHKGNMMGFDMNDAVFIPTGRALELLNQVGVMEIDVTYAEETTSKEVVAAVKRLLTARHGQEDFTVISQEQMLDIMGNVLDALTLAVTALGGISLVVGAVGILTIMTIAVRERTHEIGLLRAIGAPKQQILILFLGEAGALSLIGGCLGLVTGALIAQALRLIVPDLPVYTPWSFVLGSLVLSLAIGLVAGVAPARRAASLDPVEALRAE